MNEGLAERVAALERAVTDGNHDLSALAGDAELADRIEALETDVETLTDRVDELDAATRALRGYVGNVEAVNREVERQAEAALAAVESLESRDRHGRQGGPPSFDAETDSRDRLDGGERARANGGGRTGSPDVSACPTCGQPRDDEEGPTAPSAGHETAEFREEGRDRTELGGSAVNHESARPPDSVDAEASVGRTGERADPIERIKNLL